MPNVYCSLNKIPNAKGRSAYLTDKDRQEEIFIHETHMKMSWAFYSSYEKEHSNSDKENNEARELIIALPNDLYFDQQLCSTICNELAEKIIGPNHDYEFAVHWNHDRTNLHTHILFSEREIRNDLEPKKYRKDIWHDRSTHKLAKANADNAELVHRKGEVMKDQNGNPRYETDPVTVKDKKFKTRAFIQEKNKIVSEVMNAHGYELNVQTYDSPYLSQKKIGKGSNDDYRKKVEEWNRSVREYNASVREHLEISPNIRSQYIEMKQELLKDVKEFNKTEKKITDRALELIQNMAKEIQDIVEKARIRIRESRIYAELNDYWETAKNQFADLFNKNEQIAKDNAAFHQRLNHLEQVNEKLEDRKQDLQNQYQNDLESDKGRELSL